VNLYIVDASVAAKWLLPGPAEPFQQQAVRLLEHWTNGEDRLVVPDFFWIEISNVLWKAIKLGRCTRETAEAALASLRRYDIPVLPALPLVESALEKAIAHGRTVYDSIYLALAVSVGGQVVTADEKLVNALRGQAPVIWLGAI
jgi:predicted nucleic acid-binding protein